MKDEIFTWEDELYLEYPSSDKLSDVDLSFKISDIDKLSIEDSDLKKDFSEKDELPSEDDLNLNFSSIDKLTDDDFSFKFADGDEISLEESDLE